LANPLSERVRLFNSEDDSATARYRAAAVPEDGRKAVDKFRLMFKREKMSAADVSR